MILIENPSGTERQLVQSLEGYPDWTVVQADVPDTERDKRIAEYKTPLEAELSLIQKMDAEIEVKIGEQVPPLRRQLAIDRTWGEIQRLKLANATGNVPTDLVARRKMFPTLMAVVFLSGNTLTQVATALENRLWSRVRKTSLIEAKLLLAHDSIRTASTVAGKVDATNIDWLDDQGPQ
jgi:hypothetical protein